MSNTYRVVHYFIGIAMIIRDKNGNGKPAINLDYDTASGLAMANASFNYIAAPSCCAVNHLHIDA